ncbi:hypothetical protein OBV_27860 [Oscillibacter valericigenes Sjm18-20]|nr:hypothetical protein OBV_27860 [Oscillibacter valericigenes Sjm18-20]
MSRKNPFLLFLSACIPGCGQMYQGYMKRGVSIMSTFALIIGLATWLYFGQLALALPVLWLYSFFDTYNLRRALQTGMAAPDTYPLGLSHMDQEQLSRLLEKRHSLIGWALVLLGLYGLWQAVANYFSSFLSNLFGCDFYWLASYQLPRLVIFLLVIALGIWFIRGPSHPADDGFTGFTPPSSCADAKTSPVENPAPSGAAPDGSPEYRTVSEAVSRMIHNSGTAEDGSGEPVEEEDLDHDGE